MQSIYTAGSSSYSVANLYTPAGVVNITSSYLPQNSSSFVTDNNGNTQHWNGEILTAPTSVQTSVIVDYVHPFPNSVQQIFETEKFVGYIPIPPRPPTFLSANVVSYTNILQRASFLSINLLEETDIPLQPSTNVLGVPTIVVDFVTVNDETYTTINIYTSSQLGVIPLAGYTNINAGFTVQLANPIILDIDHRTKFMI